VKLDWNDIRSPVAAEAEEQSPLLVVLTEFTEILMEHQPLQQIYDASLAAVEKLVPFQRACLLLLEGEGQPVLKAARCKVGRSDLDLALSHTMVDTVIHERASLLVRDALSDPVFGAAHSVILEQIRSALIVPLFDNKNVIGVLYVDTRELTSVYTKEHLRRLAFFANILAVKITNARLLEAQVEQERFKAEIEAARRMQRSLLRRSEDLPCPPGYELQARLESSTEVGGDLYDVLRLPGGKFAIVLGDVVGHGMGAAILMSNALSAIRALATQLVKPVDLVQRVHAQLYSTTDSSSYLTLFIAVLDPATHELEYVNAGQDAPAILEPGGRVVRLESTSPPVALLPVGTFESARAEMPPGSLLGVWSDGITEAHPPGEQEPVFFGEVSPFTDMLATHAGTSLAALTDLVFERVDAFLGGAKAPDDRTLLLLRRSTER
jgi:sigma-B regulation protein RsbU (phosphoserine phosphatase)